MKRSKKEGVANLKGGLHKGVDFKGKVIRKLSQEQQEVLSLLTEEFLTIRQVALRRGTSTQAVYKTVAKLKKLGVVSGTQLRGLQKTGLAPKKLRPRKSKKRMIRLHGLSFKIKILENSVKYDKIRRDVNVEYLKDSTIRLYRETLIVHLNQDFIYEDENKCSAEALNHINSALFKLESRYNLTLVKQNLTQVKILTNHFAEINNELAEECNDKKLKLNIYTREDGTLWFTIDYSFNNNEAETLHKDTAQSDMTKVKCYFNDIRDNPESFKPSEVTEMIRGLTELNKWSVNNINAFAENLASHVKLVQEATETNIDLRWQMGEMTNKMIRFGELLEKFSEKI